MFKSLFKYSCEQSESKFYVKIYVIKHDLDPNSYWKILQKNLQAKNSSNVSNWIWFLFFENAYHFLFGIVLVSRPFLSSLHYFPQLSSFRLYKWPCPTPCLVTASYENLLHGRRYYTEYTPERKRKVRAFGFCTAQLVDINSVWT